jgi:glycosyltransferase involved in cell wall biosynthesis
MTLGRNARRAYEIWSEMGWSMLRQKIFRRLADQGSWSAYTHEAMIYASWMDFSPRDVDASQQIQNAHPGDLDIRTLLWLLPEFQHPFYGGIFTLLRFADYLAREKGIQQRFAILGNVEASQIAAKIAQGFPSLADFPVQTFNLYEHIKGFGETDAAVATLWPTAYFLLRYNQTRRKFYFIQDYEPLFYPAGSVYAQVEATYRFGFYGIANTPSIREIYTSQYGGQAAHFEPCVDTDIFYPGPNGHPESGPLKIFFYGRPGHPRNGFELGAQAMRLLKKRMGNRIHIVAAGDRWKPKDYGLDGVVENLGLLEYQQTAELYRSCAVGLVMMFTRHPSYLPFELMASGALVVTNYNPATTWFLKDHQNCRLSRISATCLAETLEEAIEDQAERQRITSNAVQLIRASYRDWNRQIEKIYRYMRNPAEGANAHRD